MKEKQSRVSAMFWSDAETSEHMRDVCERNSIW
jgi:hypothetical protein